MKFTFQEQIPETKVLDAIVTGNTYMLIENNFLDGAHSVLKFRSA